MADWTLLGDRTIRFPRPPRAPVRAILREAMRWADVVDVVVARDDVAVYFDRAPRLHPAVIDRLNNEPDDPEPARLVELPAVYAGPDLHQMLPHAAQMHAAGDYVVDAMGFAPGFAYLSGLDPRLAVPRRATPRSRVPAGAIGIGGDLTGVYPFASPGGWNLIGRVDGMAMFDDRGPLLRLGDRVKFVAVPGPDELPDPAEVPPTIPPTGERGLRVLDALGMVTVQDYGRRGHMFEAVPPGGALVRSLLDAANRAAGNDHDAAALEICGRLRVRAQREISIAVAGGTVIVGARERSAVVKRELVKGDIVEIASEPHRAAYLAIRGGIDVPVRLGARGTLLCGGLGGLVRRGDVYAAVVGGGWNASTVVTDDPDVGNMVRRAGPDDATDLLDTRARPAIRIVPGPDRDAFPPEALATLCSAPYKIRADSDRVGTRLQGPAIPRMLGYPETSRPLVRGAIEVPRDGGPIVLGPEHPTTGGYPVLAVVHFDDMDRMHAVRIGGNVRFTLEKYGVR